MINDRILTKEELKAAMAELEEKGFIKYDPEDRSRFELTESGFEYAWDLMLAHSPAERAAIGILHLMIYAAVRDDNDSTG
jgi:Mn-dependent DtxR family transcriptional regulator